MIDLDSGDLRKVERLLGRFRNKAQTVLVRALNRATSNMRANIVRKTREEYNIKAKTIRSTFTVKKASRGSLGASIVSKGHKESITSYKVTPKKRVSVSKLVRVAVKKGDAKTLLNSFIINQYDFGVYKRKSDERFPLKQIYGPAVPQILNNKDVRKFVEKEAVKMYNKRIDHEIKRILEGGR